MKETSFHKVYALLAAHVRPRAASLVLVFLLASVVAFAEKAPILLLIPLIDKVLFPGSAESLASSAGEEGRLAPVLRLFDDWTGALIRWVHGADAAASGADARFTILLGVAAVIAACALIAAAAEYAFVVLSRRTGLCMVLDLRNRLAAHLIRLPLAYHGRRSFGDLMSRVSSDVTTTLNVVQSALKDLAQQPLQIAGSLAVAWAIAPGMTLGVVVLLPLIALPIAVLGRKVRKRSKKSLTSLGASVEVLTQMLRGVRTVKAFRAEEREIARYGEINRGYLRAAMRMVRAVATVESATTLISYVGFAALLLVAGWLVISQEAFRTNGAMFGFLTAIATTYQNIKSLSTTVGRIQESAGAAERLQGLLEEQVTIADRPGARPLASLGSGLCFEGVSFRYPGVDGEAIQGLSLEVRPGETLALVGRSGAGKTTLVDLVARFIEPQKGRVAVDGHDLRDATLDSWSRLYAMVTQEPFLFHTTILENIRYGRPGATLAEVEGAARAANIHDFVASLPDGYATVVGDQGARLSGGQRQRITIARAILKDAPLLLLDEATSALDSESEAVVQEALERLMKDRMVIVIAHRLSTVRNADRIAVLDEGRLVELGRHAELLARGGIYASLHAAQFASPPLAERV